MSKITDPFDPKLLAALAELVADGEEKILIKVPSDLILAQLGEAVLDRLNKILRAADSVLALGIPELKESMYMESAALRVLGNRILHHLLLRKAAAEKSTALKAQSRLN